MTKMEFWVSKSVEDIRKKASQIGVTPELLLLWTIREYTQKVTALELELRAARMLLNEYQMLQSVLNEYLEEAKLINETYNDEENR